EAKSRFHELAEKFPNSEHAPEYRFLHEWATVCGIAADPGDNLAAAVARLDQFIKDHKKDPFMKQYGQDAGKLLLSLTKTFAEHPTAPAGERPLAVVRDIEQLKSTVEEVVPDALRKTDRTKVESHLDTVRAEARRLSELRDVLDQLPQLPNEKPFDAIKR